MKFINKGPEPPYFKSDTLGLAIWDDYDSTPKRKLKKHILNNEQFWLCCYCEKKIRLNGQKSHIEHIEPKQNNPSKLTFLYSNLIVSCQGDHCNEQGYNTKHICGHKKGKEFDKNLFLDPTLNKKIASHFVFDRNGVISPAGANKAKEVYTINLLNLNGNGNRLAEARKIALKSLIKKIRERKLSNLDTRAKILSLKADEGLEFCTFFRFIFRSVK